MPARVVAQDEIMRQQFQDRTRQKVEQEHQTKMERIDAVMPSFLSGILKPMASALDSYDRATSNIKGGIGETEVAIKLRLLLSDKWVLMNNVVLEPEPGVLTQIDHIVIGPLGMYVIETKAWAGAFKGYRDRWSRKDGKGWVDCESPTRQNAYHVKAIRKWFDAADGGWLPVGDWVFPVVIFTRAEWVRTQQCSVPVMNGVSEFIGFVNNQAGGAVMLPQQVDRIVQKLIAPTPRPEKKEEPRSTFLPQQSSSQGATGPSVVAIPQKEPSATLPTFEEKRTKAGRRYIRVIGNQQDANRVREQVIARGDKAGDVQKDKFTQGAWYFYLD